MYFLTFLNHIAFFSKTKTCSYPSFFILGNNWDYCRDGDETSDNEHFPECGEGLICDTGDKTWGYCKKGKFYAQKF